MSSVIGFKPSTTNGYVMKVIVQVSLIPFYYFTSSNFAGNENDSLKSHLKKELGKKLLE